MSPFAGATGSNQCALLPQEGWAWSRGPSPVSAKAPAAAATSPYCFLFGTRPSNFDLSDCRVQSETDNRPLRIQRRQPHQSHIAGQFEWPTQPTTPITATFVSFPPAAVFVVADVLRLSPRRHGVRSSDASSAALLGADAALELLLFHCLLEFAQVQHDGAAAGRGRGGASGPQCSPPALVR